MNWQQAASLMIVAATVLLFLYNRFVSRRPRAHAHCGNGGSCPLSDDRPGDPARRVAGDGGSHAAPRP